MEYWKNGIMGNDSNVTQFFLPIAIVDSNLPKNNI
jgi:hypothetical protein